MSRRAAVTAFASALATLLVAATAAAGPGVRVAGVDTAGYPHLIVNVVTAQPVTRAPRLGENGFPASGFQAVNLRAAFEAFASDAPFIERELSISSKRSTLSVRVHHGLPPEPPP